MSKPIDGDLQVWWIPQVPMKPFLVDVESVAHAAKICDVLADYDDFQFKNNIKPDYSNVGGLRVFFNGDWEDWYHEDGFTDFEEYRRIIEEDTST